MNYAYYAQPQAYGTLTFVISAMFAVFAAMAAGRLLSPVLARRGLTDSLVWYIFGVFLAVGAASWVIIAHFVHDRVV